MLARGSGFWSRPSVCLSHSPIIKHPFSLVSPFSLISSLGSGNERWKESHGLLFRQLSPQCHSENVFSIGIVYEGSIHMYQRRWWFKKPKRHKNKLQKLIDGEFFDKRRDYSEGELKEIVEDHIAQKDIELKSEGDYEEYLFHKEKYEKDKLLDQFPKHQYDLFMKHRCLLQARRHVKITAGGRVYSFSALVILGNGDGTGGFGYGKAPEIAKAVSNAEKDAMKHLVSIELFEGCTLPVKEGHAKVGATRVSIKRKGKNTGLSGNNLLITFASYFGLTDLMIRVIGRRNIHNMVIAFVEILNEFATTSPLDLARFLGKKYVDLSKIWKPVMKDHYGRLVPPFDEESIPYFLRRLPKAIDIKPEKENLIPESRK